MNTLIIALALAMDSFSVSICGGATMKKIKFSNAILVGIYFGGFQFLMTIIGWQGGTVFKKIIDSFDHWIALGLLIFIGGRMIIQSFDKTSTSSFSLTHKSLLMLAIATSIDALGIGLSFALLRQNIISASITIGIVAFIFSAIGIYLGKACKKLLNKKAELIGGIILVAIGLQISIEHGAFNL